MRALAHQCFGPTGGSIPPATREVTASLTNKQQQTFRRMFQTGSGGREKSSRSAGFMAIAIFSEQSTRNPRRDRKTSLSPSGQVIEVASDFCAMTCLRRVEQAKTATTMLELTEVMLSEVIADSSHGVAMRSRAANEVACKAGRCVVSKSETSELCTK